ncbi:hypothetical protein D0C36_19445 [Mucilaginibacter conchicola]|uniref:Uncharacterized protein n=1 Tax=Mucilaginibacter conchicola TaxID=2303333 RepID=A0A372NQI1_9SPHI|nr:hypothetical protein [Mucilaginibacter conchicola]RFZ91118.1 hypothetical protein D0C36_19445 [Mucilaginibacter conchicola]
MVKIKEGYVMSAKEKAEYERVNALPRKKEGFAAYYFKPQTKYPPRIYVFMHSEIWCDRNRRPMGLFYAFPFLTRPMNREKIEYHHFNTRLCYHQYEDWDKLLFAERQEADQLDLENPGTGSSFLEKLNSFRTKYRLNANKVLKSLTDEELLIRSLFDNGHQMDAAQISRMLCEDHKGPKRLPVIIMLRQLYKNAGLPPEQRTVITEELLSRKVKVSIDRTRRNLVRRVYHGNKLFALEEIRESYPGYTEIQLLADLRIPKSKNRKIKKQPYTDLRRCQLQKLAAKIARGGLDAKEYHTICCRIVMLQQAHDCRVPIPLTVTLDKMTEIYSFSWKTRESVVKSFVNLANTGGMTHDILKARHQEMVSSNYSY